MEWVLGILAVLVGAVVLIYNRLVALRQTCRNAFADIDVQLKLRSDLVPNLVETVKGYAGHEKQVLENVTAARARAQTASSPGERIAAENALSQALMQLYAVAENYPQLKANENFLGLQRELADIENKIAAARRFLNNASNEYNTAIEQFPAVIVARLFTFAANPFWEMTEADRALAVAPPQVKF